MDDDLLRTTLAYTKSPKTSRRTTFQDELEAAVSARAGRQKTAESSVYSDDFDDDEDDIFKELLKMRKKKMDTFKAGRTKAKINDFKLSDDEEENVRPKKVTFMKTKRKSSPVQEPQADMDDGGRGSASSSTSRMSPQSTRELLTPEKSQQDSQSESPVFGRSLSEWSSSRRSLSESPLPLNWENSQPDSPQSFQQEKEEKQKVLGEGEEKPPVPRSREVNARRSSSKGSVEDKHPKPKPRHRGVYTVSDGHDEGDGRAETPSSRAATSSVSIGLCSTASSDRAAASGSDANQSREEESTVDAQSPETLTRSLEGAADHDSALSEQSKEEKYSMSFEEYQEVSVDSSHVSAGRQSQTLSRSQDRPPSSRLPSSTKSKIYVAQSKYLGSLKVLDQKAAFQENQLDGSDSLRASVYQTWLSKKQEQLQETIRARKQEEKLKEEKKMQELSKKEDAKTSYEAWLERKREVMREKIQEKQEVMRKEQEEKEKKEERQEMAKVMFKKWKEEHDSDLNEQFRKQAMEKQRLKEQTKQKKEERKLESASSFNHWSQKKKGAIKEKVKEEQEKERIKEIEERYQKEEREKTALEMYESWLRRKDLQLRKQKREEKIRAIVPEEAPPPWSPPNRTIPFGK